MGGAMAGIAQSSDGRTDGRTDGHTTAQHSTAQHSTAAEEDRIHTARSLRRTYKAAIIMLSEAQRSGSKGQMEEAEAAVIQRDMMCDPVQK